MKGGTIRSETEVAMKQTDYCRVVSGIRWTAQQRQRIESLLRLPADSPEFVDQTEFTVVSEVTKEDLEMMEKENAKKSKKHIKLWVILAAAMLLAGGGAAAGVVAMRQHNKQETSMEDQLFTLHLTDQCAGQITSPNEYDCRAGYSSLCETENGWYYRTMEGVLYYTDKETGQSVPLCARPNCLHDGNEYCTASTEKYSTTNHFFYDGYLYAAANKKNNEDYTDSRAVLLRYEPDGSAITELCEFTGQDCIGMTNAVLHRGYIWVGVTTEYGFNEYMRHTEQDRVRHGGYEIYGYELATGKTVKLLSAMPPQNEAVMYEGIRGIIGDGDYLYVHTDYEPYTGRDYPEGQKCKMFRISLLTGETEAFPELDEMRMYMFVVSNNRIFCTSQQSSLCIFDPETKEFTKTFSDCGWVYCTDGSYLYIPFYESDKCTLKVFDFSGNQINEQIQTEYIDQVQIINGKLYMSTSPYQGDREDGVVRTLRCCDPAAFREGKAEWTTVMQWTTDPSGGNFKPLEKNTKGGADTDAQ